jgi:hypothetical protein
MRAQNGAPGSQHEPLNARSACFGSAQAGSPTAQAIAAIAQVQRRKWKMLMSRFRRRTTCYRSMSFKSRAQATDPPRTPADEAMYLLLCHSEGLHATKLLQIDVCHLKTDEKLFDQLRAAYRSIHGKWWSMLSFRALTSIRFVRFELFESELVDVQMENDIPHPEREGRHYRYTPKPPAVIPPVGKNHLMHLFQHPEDAGARTICLDRFPKKMRERLTVCCDTGVSLGWGLQLEEGWDQRKTWILAFVILVVGSATLGILWAVFEHSIQDAFAISGYMTAVAVLSIGFTQAMVGNLR